MKKLLIAVMAVLMLGACAQSGAIENGDKAPDFTLQTMDSGSAKSSDYSGKVVVMDFFASWCPPCRAAVPDLVELQNKYGQGAFTVLGVSLEGPADTKKFAEKMGINYPVLIDDGRVSADYGPIRSIPTIFVIDKDAKIANRHVGYGAGDKAKFESEIEELLK